MSQEADVSKPIEPVAKPYETIPWRDYPLKTRKRIVLCAVLSVVYAVLAWMIGAQVLPEAWTLKTLGVMAAVYGLANPYWMKHMQRHDMSQIWTIVFGLFAMTFLFVAMMHGKDPASFRDAGIAMGLFALGAALLCFAMATGWAAGYEYAWTSFSRLNPDSSLNAEASLLTDATPIDGQASS